MKAENDGYEPVYTGKVARQKGDECSGEEREKGEGTLER